MFSEENEKMEEYIKFLSDKGKIAKIKDTSKNMNIKFSTGIVYYFLLVIFICVSALTLFLIINKNSVFDGYDLLSSFIIISGAILLSVILFFVVKNEKEKLKLDVIYLNDNEMKVNNNIYNIQGNECYIDIKRVNEKIYTGDKFDYRKKVINYYLIIYRKNKNKKLLIIPGTESQIGDFIYNFEFEISDFKKTKYELISKMKEQYNNLNK